ncbi:MAG: DUF4145 domain-containing protein [Planctomycetes bacterium]|nr:DUF4145 domain-containing protein [Planctomycetota bacterium]
MSDDWDLSYNHGTHEGEDVRCPCPDCGRDTYHTVLTNVVQLGSSESRSMQFWDDYQVVECKGCKRCSFRKVYADSESVDLSRGEADETIEHYPQRINNRRAIPDAHLIPAEVLPIYEETLAALRSNLPILAGIGVRAIVEAVCKHVSATGRTLESRIDDLVPKGFLTSDGARVLHATRLMGNVAAHEMLAHTNDDLIKGIEIAEHLLRTVYVIPAIADGLSRRSST